MTRRAGPHPRATRSEGSRIAHGPPRSARRRERLCGRRAKAEGRAVRRGRSGLGVRVTHAHASSRETHLRRSEGASESRIDLEVVAQNGWWPPSSSQFKGETRVFSKWAQARNVRRDPDPHPWPLSRS